MKHKYTMLFLAASIGATLAVIQHHGWLTWLPSWMLPPGSS